MRAVSSGVFLFDPLEEGSSTTSYESGSVTVVAYERLFFSLAFRIKAWSCSSEIVFILSEKEKK
ncbi:hypothetical protein A2U01_0084509, partial [Trifolium medium]|nr:hypothetical protein [Trifolium medium]